LTTARVCWESPGQAPRSTQRVSVAQESGSRPQAWNSGARPECPRWWRHVVCRSLIDKDQAPGSEEALPRSLRAHTRRAL